jgi:hypothetical protein
MSLVCRFRAFYLGFHSVCASNALIMLRPEEVSTVLFVLDSPERRGGGGMVRRG